MIKASMTTHGMLSDTHHPGMPADQDQSEMSSSEESCPLEDQNGTEGLQQPEESWDRRTARVRDRGERRQLFNSTTLYL